MLPPHLTLPSASQGSESRLGYQGPRPLFLEPRSPLPSGSPQPSYRGRRRLPNLESSLFSRPGPRAQWSGPGGRLLNCELARRPRAGLARRAPAVLRLAADRTGRRPHLRRDQ